MSELDGDVVRAVVRQYGTPTYLYDLDELSASIASLRASLPPSTSLHYSLKANSDPALVEAAVQAGCGADVSSLSELFTALRAGAGFISYSGPGKTDTEIREAISAGCTRFSIESLEELRTLDRIASEQRAPVDYMIRVDPTNRSRGPGLSMSGSGTTFGVPFQELMDEPGLFVTGGDGAQFRGFHFFPLSNARDVESLVASLEASIQIAHELSLKFGIPREINLGGGFGARFAKPGAPDRDCLSGIVSLLEQHFPGWRKGEPHVSFESGRRIVGASGTLLTRVTRIRNLGGPIFAVLESGINHLGGLSGLGRVLPLRAQPTVLDPDFRPRLSANLQTYNLVGPLCTPADVLARGIELPRLEEGDLLAFENVGAYGLSVGLLAFLSRPTPIEVTIKNRKIVQASRMTLVRASVSAVSHAARETNEIC